MDDIQFCIHVLINQTFLISRCAFLGLKTPTSGLRLMESLNSNVNPMELAYICDL